MQINQSWGGGVIGRTPCSETHIGGYVRVTALRSGYRL